MERVCKKCDGMGMLLLERADGGHLAEPCECRVEKRVAQLYERTRIPERYKSCTLENYEHSYAGADKSLWKAFNIARKFVDDYHHAPKGVGLLFTGPVGTGKTHLAVGILQALVLQKGVPALFCDNRGLLKAINNAYNPRVTATELEILRPVFEAEVLVLDEVGSAKKTEWVSDMVEHILNTRYNDNRTTIITTNYPNRPTPQFPAKVGRDNADKAASVAASQRSDMGLDDVLNRLDSLAGRSMETGSAQPSGRFEKNAGTAGAEFEPLSLKRTSIGAMDRLDGNQQTDSDAGSIGAGGVTLGDRIGERMRSRLMEMCVTVEMRGKDYRQDQKRARFS